MRVAVSGTHCCGKSTLIDAFLLTHSDFAHEPEPYTALTEDYGEVFAAVNSATERAGDTGLEAGEDDTNGI